MTPDERARATANVSIRPCRPEDRETIVGLWQAAGLTRPWNDPHLDVQRKLADSPWGMLVAEWEGVVVGTAMVGYDGHRGSVNYLAVSRDRRGRGIGGALMDHAEALLRDRGCPKVNLFVRADNLEVARFYEARGYRLQSAAHAVAFGLRLIPDEAAG